LKYVTSPNKSVTLRCRPPGGSPPLNITWFKNGEPLILGRGRRLRLTYKKDLVIRRLCSNDSGEYQCVAENMAARREGQVITLDVRGLQFVVFLIFFSFLLRTVVKPEQNPVPFV